MCKENQVLPMAFRAHDVASGQVVAFIVSAAMLTGIVGGVLYVSQQTGKDDGDVASANTGLDAEGIAEALVASPGVGWDVGADSVTRFGLRNASTDGLEVAHLDRLRGAGLAASTNGLLDYEEARSALGLTGDLGTQFHISIHPVALQDNLDKVLADVKTAYIGDWTDLPDVTVTFGTDAAMKSAAQAALNATMDVTTGDERSVVRDIGLDFQDTIYIDGEPFVDVDMFPLPNQPLLGLLNTTEIEGDVYPDHKAYLDVVLAPRLATAGYDQLIVGSTVDHESLTSAVTKNAIRDFVLNGGTLLVMGSESQNFQWLQPLFQVGTDTVNGGAFAPDLGHPVLWVPNELGWQAYDNFGLAWDIKSQGANSHYDDFEHVVQDDGDDVLAVSADGAFGSGRIFLTTYRPEDIFSNSGIDEAGAFLENLILYADRSHLHLEYGPAIPTGTAIASAVRYSSIDDPDLGRITVSLQVRAWDGVAFQSV